MLRRFVASLFACWWLMAPAVSQKQPDTVKKPAKAAIESQTRLHLTRVGVTDVPNVSADFFTPPFKCDHNGNIYRRQSDARDPGVQKIDAKGKPVAWFRPAPNTDKKLDYGGSFDVAPNGDLYELVYPHELNRYVFTYKPDGSFKAAIKVDAGFKWFFPSTVAVFASGQMLIAGSKYDKDVTSAKWPFTGIFAPDGSLLREVKLEDDETLHDMAAVGDVRVVIDADPQRNKAVSFTQIEMAPDGNAYLMRWTNPAIIYAISPGGEVVRRLKIDPEESEYYPLTLHVSQNRIAILFVEPETSEKVMIMKIIDLEGHEIATYDELRASERQTMLTAAFYCYTENPTSFLFLGANDEGRLQFWTVEPR